MSCCRNRNFDFTKSKIDTTDASADKKLNLYQTGPRRTGRATES
ncbi:MAG: hypothetical protein ACI8RD_005317 [Bacillariaceae sp.]|jgi:hypothetical protein